MELISSDYFKLALGNQHIFYEVEKSGTRILPYLIDPEFESVAQQICRI